MDEECKPLVEAIKRELADGTFPLVKPTEDGLYKFIVEYVQAEIAKTGAAIDVEKIVQLGLTQFCLKKLEAEGKIEKQMRVNPETGEVHAVYRAKLPN